MDNTNIPNNFTKEEVCSIIENALPNVEDPIEMINGMLMAAGRYIGFVTKDVSTSNNAILGLLECYIKKGCEDAEQVRKKLSL